LKPSAARNCFLNTTLKQKNKVHMYQNFKWKIFQISQPYIGEIEIKGSPLIFIFLSHSKSQKKNYRQSQISL
jgi:hypothetical protein